MTSSGSSPPSSSSTSLTSSPTEKRAANTSKSLLTTAGATTTTTTTTIRTTTTTRKQTTTSTNTTRTTSTRGTKPKANQFGTLVHATSSLAATSASTPALGRVRRPREAFVPVPEPPPLYIITPTYRRPEQLAELTRLGYTLKHVTNLLWLVIEDANETSPLVFDILDRIGVPYHYLLAPMPAQYRIKRFKPRGVSNRNRGLAYIRANATEGVFYFADDDNTYDVSLFEQMRYTKMVSMWPVGLVTNTGVSSPIVRDGKLNGFYDGWIGGRKYPVDMAGFAVSVKFLLQRPNATMPFVVGYEEDGFLRSLKPLSNDDIELLANKCTEILTWHTQTKKNPSAIALNQTRYGGTNLIAIDKLLVRS
ncbi:galactosylgalactosylxylosylprotein 3-beta-glucuronosyltransferase P isoform X2 [Scaptodrosophila lebanonensis]|nr:galactosylgalactosylxylosylprotein 3-beta-glucuronosyltransferase P isoform X2 [Scaptodrosophila lebanonensis]